MSIQTKSILESKFVSHSYPYIDLLQRYSTQKYDGFYALAQEVEWKLNQLLTENQIDYLRYPDNDVLMNVEEEQEIVFMYEKPDSDEYDFYKLARLTTYYPYSHTEKPSGLILSDGSYLQFDFTFAHHLKTRQMFLLFLSFHYGRCNADRREFYFFRFDKESDYMIHGRNSEFLDYKSIYHFHGNCDEPHFPLPSFQWDEKMEYIIKLLANNLQRIKQKTGESVF